MTKGLRRLPWIAAPVLMAAMHLVARRYHLPLPDLHLGYRLADLQAWARGMTPEARRAFVLWHLGLDLLWPLVYGALLWQAVCRAQRRCPGLRMLSPAWIVGAVLADFGENLLLSWLFGKGPPLSPGLATAASLCTLLKWGLLLGTFLSLAVVPGCAARLRNRS